MFLINQQHEISEHSWHILCDFDGTISLEDTTDHLLEKFALTGWQDIEQQWEHGLIGSKQCMQQQIALLNMNQQQLYQCLDQIKIDQGFLDLVQLTHRHHIPLTIVSDGLDRVIQYILKKHNIEPLPIIANHLVQVNDMQWRLEFPNADVACKSASGTCKCKVALAQKQEHIILIGDGRSDFCLAETADFVFAKKSLIQYCKSKQISHTPFSIFSEIYQPLEKLLLSDFELEHCEMVIA